MRLEDDISVDATVFVHEMNEKVQNLGISSNCVWNADQSRFEYEPMRNRTIARKGEKIVEARVVDHNAVSHSYSIQVHMSKNGTLGSKIYIVLQEKTGGAFGPSVQQKLNEILEYCPNVVVSCTKFGKFTSDLMRKWFTDTFLLDVAGSPESLLLLDAWSGQGPTAGLDDARVSIEYIPKGATKYVQPLDVYFFRHYKTLVKNIMESCRDLYLDEEIAVRPANHYFIVKLHCVCYNQLQHPRFKEAWKYAWRKPGYEVEGERARFEKISDVLFGPLNSRESHCLIHDDFPLLKCVYCDQFLCFECMFHPVHYHIL